MRKSLIKFINLFKSKTWPKFKRLIVVITIASIALSCGIWKFLFGKGLNIHWAHIEIDFFNTLGVVFTIIGLGIALYQIAELRSESEIREDATNQVNREHFVNDTRVIVVD